MLLYRPQNSSTLFSVTTLYRFAPQLSRRSLALDVPLCIGLSNHSVHELYRGCFTLKWTGSWNTVRSSPSAGGAGASSAAPSALGASVAEASSFFGRLSSIAVASAACDEASGSGASALAPAAGIVVVAAPSGWVDGSEAIAV